jgi:hypothetical protein
MASFLDFLPGMDSGGAGAGLMSYASNNYRSMGLSALQGGSTALSILGQLGAARARSSAYRAAGDQASADAEAAPIFGRLQSQQIGVAGNAAAGKIKQQLFDTLSARTSAIGASGVDLGPGIATDSARTITGRAVDAEATQGYETQEAQSAAQLNAVMRAYRSRLTALQDYSQADQATRTGTLQALGSAGSMLLSFLSRG